jgi:hypothetical protein
VAALEYDYGKTIQGGRLEQTGSLNKPPQILLNAISQLTANYKRGTVGISEILSDALAKNPKMTPYFTNPGPEQDRLFRATYDHIEHQEACSMCDTSQLVNRKSPPSALGPSSKGNVTLPLSLVQFSGVPTKEIIRSSTN